MLERKYKISEEKKFELIEEKRNLQEVKLKEIADRLEESRYNDLSEDDIDLGKILEEKEYVEDRIEEIDNILGNAEILIDKDYCEPDTVKVGTSVKLKQGRRIFDIKVVSSLEADPSKNLISVDSPLGSSLVESKSGDIVKVTIRGKTIKYKILEIC